MLERKQPRRLRDPSQRYPSGLGPISSWARWSVFDVNDSSVSTNSMPARVHFVLSASIMRLRLVANEPRDRLPFGAFPWELSKTQLKRFPIILEYDRRGRFIGLTLLRTNRSRSHQTSRATGRCETR